MYVVAYNYITKHIQAKPKSKPRGTNKKVKPTMYGEVLTRDEIIERLEAEEKERGERSRKGSKKGRERDEESRERGS